MSNTYDLFSAKVYYKFKKPKVFYSFTFENERSNNKIEISAVPNEFGTENLQETFEEILEQEKNEVTIENTIKNKIVKVLAKKMAIKTGKKLEQKEMKLLLINLMNCKTPTICPNEHKIIMNLDLNSILKQF